MHNIEFLEPDALVIAQRESIVSRLREVLPADCVIDDPTELTPFETDAFTAYSRLPLAVVLPEPTAQVA
mgnify:FL=1